LLSPSPIFLFWGALTVLAHGFSLRLSLAGLPPGGLFLFPELCPFITVDGSNRFCDTMHPFWAGIGSDVMEFSQAFFVCPLCFLTLRPSPIMLYQPTAQKKSFKFFSEIFVEVLFHVPPAYEFFFSGSARSRSLWLARVHEISWMPPPPIFLSFFTTGVSAR